MVQSVCRARLLIETIAVFLFYRFAAKAVGYLAKLGGIALPDQPLLRHTYLAFLSVLLIVFWLWRSGAGLAQFGLVRPKSWGKTVLLGLGLAVVSIVFNEMVRSVTTPLLVQWTGANPHQDVATFASIRGNLPVLLLTLPSIWLYAAFGEEFIYRGYLLTRFSQLLGGTRLASGLAIAGQAVLFGLAHWYQGPVGMIPIALGALLTGVAVTRWGRILWPAMIAHGLVDTLGFVLLYAGAMHA